MNKHNNSVSVSVIIPCFCCSETLPIAIESIANQTILPKEIILVDDASDDQKKTADTIKFLKNKWSTLFQIETIFLEFNLGPASSRNKAWDIATQEYISFLDSDDTWVENKLELQWNWLIRNPNTTLMGCSRTLNQMSSGIENLIIPKKIKSADLLWRNPFCTSGIILKKDIRYRFPENKYYSEDFSLWADVIADSDYEAYMSNSELIVAYKKHNREGLSGNLKEMLKGELAVLKKISMKFKFPFLYMIVASWSITKYLKRILF